MNRDSRDDDLMRDGQISGQIDEDRNRERDRLRGLVEQRWCSVVLGHDTLQTQMICIGSYSSLKAGVNVTRTTGDVRLCTAYRYTGSKKTF